MNELDQIEEILSGSHRYKFLDPKRKAVLALPPSAFKLWMALWMLESDGREAYPSIETLAKITCMTENTIRTAREYLLKTGWLVKLTGSAAERYPHPSRGSHSVAVYRVNDPTNNPSKFDPSNVWVPNSAPNVCSCCCTCPCSCLEVRVDTTIKLEPEGDAILSPASSLRSDEKQKQNQQQEQKQKPLRSASATKWLQKYDSPMPVDFNTWSQETRSRWVVEHDRRNLKVPSPVEVEAESKPTVLPVAITAQVPTPPDVTESATPTSPESGYESHEPVTDTATAPAKAPALSATPAPPTSASPPKPAAPIDYRLEWIKMIAKEICTYQTSLGGNLKPPTDWETAWLPDTDALVKLTEGKDSMSCSMLTSIVALSQVRYAAKYTTPAAIWADVVPLGREVVERITKGTFEEIHIAFDEVVCPPEKQSDKNGRDEDPTMWVDPEVKAAREQRELSNRIARWNAWLDAQSPEEKTA